MQEAYYLWSFNVHDSSKQASNAQLVPIDAQLVPKDYFRRSTKYSDTILSQFFPKNYCCGPYVQSSAIDFAIDFTQPTHLKGSSKKPWITGPFSHLMGPPCDQLIANFPLTQFPPIIFILNSATDRTETTNLKIYRNPLLKQLKPLCCGSSSKLPAKEMPF